VALSPTPQREAATASVAASGGGPRLPEHSAVLMAAVMQHVGRQPPAPPLTVEELARARAGADARIRAAVTERTRALHIAELSGLAQWLSRLPPDPATRQPVTLLSCEPAHVTDYVDFMKDPGAKAAGTVANYIKSMSGGFNRLGRTGEHSLGAPLGNPCRSQPVRAYVQGVAKQATSRGQSVTAARPLTAAKLCWLAQSLAARAADPDTSPRDRMLLLRDLVCALYMWLTATRGGDAVRLRCDEFVTAPGNGLEVMSSAGWAAVEAAGADPAASAPRLYIWPHQSKTCKQQRPPMQVVLPQPNPQHCFVRALGKYRLACAAAGHPLELHLMRSERTGAAMTAQNLAGRLRGHMQLAGIYEGETLHSYRRGALQDAVHTQCWTELQAQLLGNIKAPAILQLYLDRNRHRAWGGPPPANPGVSRAPRALAQRDVVTTCTVADPDYSDSDDE
jgi:hypothetical protein